MLFYTMSHWVDVHFLLQAQPKVIYSFFKINRQLNIKSLEALRWYLDIHIDFLIILQRAVHRIWCKTNVYSFPRKIYRG